MKLRNRLATALLALAAAGSGTLFTATAAHASPSPSDYTPVHLNNHYDEMEFTYAGHVAALAAWNQDPYHGFPGDSIRAYDGYADGYGVHVYLNTNDEVGVGRLASTAGHNSPYWSPWASGNLPEGHAYYMILCLEKRGSDLVCTSRSVAS